MAGHAAPNIVEDGLVFYADAANPRSYPGSGINVDDLTGSTTGSWSDTGIFISDNSGVFGLDGIDDYLTFQSDTLPTLGGSYTYSTWIKTTDSQGEIFCNFHQSSPWKGMLFGIGFNGSDGKLQLWMCSDAGAQTTTKDTGATVNDGNWKNVVATYDGTNARFYHDSQLSSTVSVSNTVASNSFTYPLRIGASNNAGPNRLFLGRIGPVQIYNRTLSTQEVNQNYNALKSRFT